MAMKLGASARRLWAWASGGSTLDLGGRPMPLADENTWWLVSIAMMSLYLVIDQNAPVVAVRRPVHRILGAQALEVGPVRVVAKGGRPGRVEGSSGVS